jgi:hypothetical protein
VSNEYDIPVAESSTVLSNLWLKNVQSYIIEAVAPPGYEVSLNGVRRGRLEEKGPLSSNDARSLKIGLGRYGQRDKVSELPLGHPTSVKWYAPLPSVGTDAWPSIEIDIGAAANNEALPLLRIPIHPWDFAEDELMVPGVDDIVNVKEPNNGGSTVAFFQGKLELRPDPTTSGNFYVYIYNSTGTKILTYFFDFGGWNSSLRHVWVSRTYPSGDQYKTLVVGAGINAGGFMANPWGTGSLSIDTRVG